MQPLIVGVMLCVTSIFAENAQQLVLPCKPDNDLYPVMLTNQLDCIRHDTALQAAQTIATNAGALILADNYPQRTTAVDKALF